MTGLLWLGMAATFEGGGGSGMRLVVGSNVAGDDVISLEVLKNGRETEVFIVCDRRVLVEI